MDTMAVTGVMRIARAQNQRLANGLEQAFLAEALKYAGPQESSGEFSGGVGESQFSSMLNDVYADAIAQRIDMRLHSRTEMT
ncbi:hypothetical protein [Paracoccus sp. (in: a-proteobacteria)]|uniref:hypothetical protein n=1 Tax=Paracoccus sp. TaxID=267 RepID=UPI0039188267